MDKWGDGIGEMDVLEEVLVDNKTYAIGIDKLQRVRLIIKDRSTIKEGVQVSNLIKIVVDIDSLPMSDDERDLYKRDIANIYQIGLTEGEEVAKEYASNIKKIIEKNLLIQRKKQLFLPCIIAFTFIIIFSNIDIIRVVLSDYYFPIVFGSIGGMLSVINQNGKLDIDYKIDINLLTFESTKIVLISIITAIIGSIAIKSNLILGNLYEYSTNYFEFLIYILCGYSPTFIPNLLKNIEVSSIEKK